MSTCHNSVFCVIICVPQSPSIPQSSMREYFCTEENDKKLQQELHV